jgi:hypothetical protein
MQQERKVEQWLRRAHALIIVYGEIEERHRHDKISGTGTSEPGKLKTWTDFLRTRGSGSGSTQPREDNRGATGMNK